MQRSVFLVEDEDALRGLLAGHLRKRGHRVLDAADAEGAVRHLVRQPPFDLLITDIHLPNLSGIELLRLLQAHSPMKPVLVITGDDDDAIAEEAIGHGAAGYLLKPFELSELDAAIAQALRHLELVERLGEAEVPAPDSQLGVPVEWLEVADARSGAGPGHGRRVERLATVLAKRCGLMEFDDLAAAARLHEVGRLVASGRPPAMIPELSAGILEHTTVEPRVRRLIEGMREWEAPAHAEAAMTTGTVLGIADGIDHRAMARVHDGAFAPTAIIDAIEDVTTMLRRVPGTAAGAALDEAREVISALWILSRGGYPSEPPRRRADAGGEARREGGP